MFIFIIHMKKWLVLIPIIILLFVAGTYILIPSTLDISKVELVKCNVNAASRIINEDSNWNKWWSPGGESGYCYKISRKLYQQVEVPFISSRLIAVSTLNFLSLNGKDSVVFRWDCSFKASLNPIKRIQQYREALSISRAMNAVISNLRIFLEDKKNVYGINMREIMGKDTALMASKMVTGFYPGTNDVYKLIKDIRNYIKSQGAVETGYPMLNIKKTGDYQFECMVAIPINRGLKGNSKFFPKHFVPLKILVADVKGGSYSVNGAMNQMQLYIADYQRTVMAIPFQSLITERDQVSDTSDWQTRIVQPIF